MPFTDTFTSEGTSEGEHIAGMQNNKDSSTTLLKLPNELLTQITEYLPSSAKGNLLTVNRQFHDIAQRSLQDKIKVLIQDWAIRSSFPLDKVDERYPTTELTIEADNVPTPTDHSRCYACQSLSAQNGRPTSCFVAEEEDRDIEKMECIKADATRLFANRPIKEVRTCRVNHGSQYGSFESPFNIGEIIGDLPWESLVQVTVNEESGFIDRFLVSYKDSSTGATNSFAGDAVTVGNLLLNQQECTWVSGYENGDKTMSAEVDTVEMRLLRNHIGSIIRAEDEEEEAAKISSLIDSYLSFCSLEDFEATEAGQALSAYKKDILETQKEKDGFLFGEPGDPSSAEDRQRATELYYRYKPTPSTEDLALNADINVSLRTTISHTASGSGLVGNDPSCS